MVRHKLLTVFSFLIFLFNSPHSSRAQWVPTSGPKISIHVARTAILLGTTSTEVLDATSNDSLFFSTDDGATWQDRAIPWHEQVQLFAFGGNELFVITQSGKLFFSSDNGTNWTSTNDGPPNSSILSFAVNGSYSFAGSTNGQIFRSTDNGLNWAPANTGLINSSVIALAVIGTTVLAGTQYGGIFASTDSGGHWVTSSNGLTGIGATAFGVNGSLVYAETPDKGVFLSTNSGASWSLANTGLTASVAQFAAMGPLEFAATQSNGIFLTTNNGTTWSAANGNLPNLNIRSFVINNSVLFASASDGNVYRSSDSGISWIQESTGYDTGSYVPVTALLSYEDTLYAGTFHGVFLTSDNGGSWQPAGLQDKFVNALAKIGTNLFAAVDTGVYLTTDNGLNWKPLIFDDSLSRLYGPPLIYSLAVNGTELYAAGGGYGTGGVYSTKDNGSHWNHLMSRNASLIMANNGNLFVSADGIIMFSSDDGASWSPANTGMPGNNVTAFAAIGSTLFSGTASNGVYFSTNTGASWLPVAQGSTPNEIYSLDTMGTDLFAGTQSGVYLTTNSGENWSADNTGLITSIRALASQNEYLFAATYSVGVWRQSLAPSEVFSNSSLISSVAVNPNPFESFITITVAMADRKPAQIRIVNAIGVPVTQLFQGMLEPGEHSFTWTPQGVPSGTYWCELFADGHISRTAIILNR